ncbi:MAG: tripartite tricarboxylate transporter substrate binding protein [Burkholderiales bacterium]|nr:tripartite tricarboxylate transporter substrate binding protein [Burkholderiales bacterium]MDE2398994.1 tripartite tricarboxylate transporter substrate binding protein [Burkholderiales bacterium]MDE2457517.1 tripartite tricarboxylate transporter substrate binding protein [Burkholderiales bacterium]
MSLRTLLIACAALLASSLSCAAGFPSQRITIVVPFPAGGPNDLLARMAAEKMAAELKQPVVVENRPGAGGNIGVAAVAHAPADGYTILCTIDTPLTVNPSLFSHLGFDPAKDLTPLSLAVRFSQMLTVNPHLKADNIQQLIALAKTRPLNYATGGVGSPGQLSGAYFAKVTGTRLDAIPYKGNAPAINALIGGQVDVGFLATAGVLPQVRDGRLKALGVSSAKRSALAPEVPTFAESGLPGFDVSFAMLFMAPAQTPLDVRNELGTAIGHALAAGDVRKKLLAMDLDPVAGSPAEASAYLTEYSERWSKLVHELGLKAD